jgi:hypothetical protein
VLIDEENRRYFKQQEITIVRIPEVCLLPLSTLNVMSMSQLSASTELIGFLFRPNSLLVLYADFLYKLIDFMILEDCVVWLTLSKKVLEKVVRKRGFLRTDKRDFLRTPFHEPLSA